MEDPHCSFSQTRPSPLHDVEFRLELRIFAAPPAQPVLTGPELAGVTRHFDDRSDDRRAGRAELTRQLSRMATSLRKFHDSLAELCLVRCSCLRHLGRLLPNESGAQRKWQLHEGAHICAEANNRLVQSFGITVGNKSELRQINEFLRGEEKPSMPKSVIKARRNANHSMSARMRLSSQLAVRHKEAEKMDDSRRQPIVKAAQVRRVPARRLRMCAMCRGFVSEITCVTTRTCQRSRRACRSQWRNGCCDSERCARHTDSCVLRTQLERNDCRRHPI